jgi:dinuclear metal center YbgI/SA1388 family protein
MINRTELELYANKLLEINRFQDYCPNGLQVEGRNMIKKLATGVSASLAFLEAAQDWAADAVLVHHGFFWKNESARITGWKYRRLRVLLANDISLFGYHLPLDAHPTLGNNAQLGLQLGWQVDGHFGADALGWTAILHTPITLAALVTQVGKVLGRPPLVLGETERMVRRVAWCTGAAQGFFDEAIRAGADVYLSGEVSEATTHLAREAGVAYLAAGHHATERYGVQALGAHLADTFQIAHRFIEIDNPV